MQGLLDVEEFKRDLVNAYRASCDNQAGAAFLTPASLLVSNSKAAAGAVGLFY